MYEKIKIKTASLLFALVLFFSPVFAERAHAQWFVFDGANFVNTLANMTKDYGLDSIAFQVANSIIEQLAASTVNWINNGFNGSPAFVSNPESYFTNLGDQIAGQYIYSNPNFKFMCAPFKAKVQIAINQAYLNPGSFSCTLTGIGKNFDNFIGDFSQGGWDSFIEITQNSQNNPLGLFQNWQNQIALKQGEAKENAQQELLQGGGFLTFKKCSSAGTITQANIDANKKLEESGALKPENNALRGKVAGDCVGKKETVTPGSVISDQLNTTLSAGTGRLEVADEINEIITALLGQLTKKALSGLAGLSKPDPSDNNKTFTTDLYSATANDPGIQGVISGAEGIKTSSEQALIDAKNRENARNPYAGTSQPTLETAWQEGYNAGVAKNPTNKYPAGTAENYRWQEGYEAGLRFIPSSTNATGGTTGGTTTGGTTRPPGSTTGTLPGDNSGTTGGNSGNSIRPPADTSGYENSLNPDGSRG